MKNSRLLLEHHQLPEEIVVDIEEYQKAWATHNTEEVQECILKDRKLIMSELEVR
jgi:hypothetical protein